MGAVVALSSQPRYDMKFHVCSPRFSAFTSVILKVANIDCNVIGLFRVDS